MKVRFNRWYKALLTSLLALLGYESCDSDSSGDIMVEYGAPTAHFMIKGKITDEAGNPIPAIKASIKMYDKEFPEDAYGVDSTLTDFSGGYTLECEYYNPYNHLILEDVDGEANGGAFESDTIRIHDLEDKKVEEGNGRWYEGKYEATANIKLKRKQQSQ